MIKNAVVNNLSDSIRVSGYPMSVDVNDVSISIGRANKLGRAKIGSGHDCFLKGIDVFLEIEGTLKWFDQFDRYSFQDTISSTSQMHRITEFDLENQFHKSTDINIIELVQVLVDIYKEDPTTENFERIIYNVPQGFLYTRAITTNYLQLKTIYYQRRHHKLKEWREFCKELEDLPMFMELIGEVK